MASKKQWLKVGTVLKQKLKEGQAPGTEGTYVRVDLTYWDGVKKEQVTLPELTLKPGMNLAAFDPRTSPGMTPEKAAKIPDYVLRELFLVSGDKAPF